MLCIYIRISRIFYANTTSATLWKKLTTFDHKCRKIAGESTVTFSITSALFCKAFRAVNQVDTGCHTSPCTIQMELIEHILPLTYVL